MCVCVCVYTTDFSTIKIQSARNKIDEVCFFARVPCLYYAIRYTIRTL